MATPKKTETNSSLVTATPKATTKTIWITRDMKGDDDKTYFWNTKPTWNQENCTYSCPIEGCKHQGRDCEAEIVTVTSKCTDLRKICKALGIETTYGHAIKKGEMIELTTKIKASTGVSLGQKAHDLAKRLQSKKKPSQKDIVKFLESIECEKSEPDAKADVDVTNW